LKKWEEKSIKNSESARIRWDKNNANAYERIKRNANHADKDIVTDKDNVKVKDTVKENKTLEWFLKQFDEMFVESLKMTHKGKDFMQAAKESYAHLAADPVRLKMAETQDCKRLLNTWLSNQKIQKNGKQPTASTVEDWTNIATSYLASKETGA